VLNTVDKEDVIMDSIDGNATIKGPNNGLFIKVEANQRKLVKLKFR
jgi:hypothetical protein